MYEFFRRFMPPDQRGAPRGRDDKNGKGEPRQGPRGPLRPFGLGSGFIDLEGRQHRHQRARRGRMRTKSPSSFKDKREFSAKVIGVDEISDVAVIKVDA